MTKEQFEQCSPHLQAFFHKIYGDIQASRATRRDMDDSGWRQKLDGSWWFRNVEELPEFFTWLALPCPRDPVRG